MRVGQYNGYASNNISVGTKKIGSVSLPDYNEISYCTKTTPSMSDDKFKEAIIDQAKKDQAAGKFNTPSTQKLLKNYVSVVSPDRKGFITEALTQIAKKPSSKNINYLDLLLFGKVTYEKSGEAFTYAEFTDKSGQHLATYSNGGWTFYSTEEEISRESGFFSIYNEAWRNAENRTGSKTQS